MIVGSKLDEKELYQVLHSPQIVRKIVVEKLTSENKNWMCVCAYDCTTY